MKKVITYGTFDLLHVGHINLLRRAKALGDYLIVVVSSDEFNAGKGKKAYHSFEDRKKILEAIRYVDEVLPEYTWEQKIDDIVNNNVDVFVMGDDWKGKFDFLKDYCEVVYLPRTEGISTTKIKDDLKDKYSCIKERRGLGLMIGLEFDRPVKDIVQTCLDNGLIVVMAGANVIRMLPPFITTEKDVDQAIAILDQAIEKNI